MSQFLDNLSLYTTQAASLLNIDASLLESLRRPNRIFQFTIPFQKKTGQIENIPAFRIQHSNILGPYKGGVRYFHSIDLGQTKALAELSTWRNALIGLPLGGAQGGIKINPSFFSLEELEELSRGYVRAIFNFIGPETDILEPGLKTDARIMSWMLDEYSKMKGDLMLAVVTGKPVHIGGAKGGNIATAYAGAQLLKMIIQDFSPHLLQSNPRAAIQGLGKVGSALAIILRRAGWKIIALSNSSGAVQTDFRKDSLEPEEILQAIKEKPQRKIAAPLYSYAKEGQLISNEALLEEDVDVLILAATENQITELNAPNVKAKIVLEVAPGAVTPEAEEILLQRDILVIPDILASGGGAVAYYFEWFQNKEDSYWPQHELLERTAKMIIDAYQEAKAVSQERGISLRTACYLKAIQRIAQEFNMKKAHKRA